MASKAVVTARVYVADKANTQPGTDPQKASLVFGPSASDETNKSWAGDNPHFDLRMTAVGRVGDDFEMGDEYIVTFEKVN